MKPRAPGFFLAAGIFLATELHAQAGHWEGAIRHEGPDLLFTVDLDNNPDWHGSFYVPGQNAPPLALSGIEINPPAVRFDLPDLPGDPMYKGILGENGSSIKGTLTQGDLIVAFEMRRTGESQVQPIPKNTGIGKAFLGDWTGTLGAGQGLRLVLHLRVDDAGAGSGTLDSADRRARNLLLSAIDQTGDSLAFDVRVIGGSYRGKLNEAGSMITGTWTQNGNPLPLEFSRQK